MSMYMGMEERSIKRPQSDSVTVPEALDVISAAKVAAIVSTAEQVDVVDETTGEALFELSSYSGGAPLTPMVASDMEIEKSSSIDASPGLFDKEAAGKKLTGEEKKMGRPSHPAWQYFARGEKRNRFHYNALCKFCHENGVKSVAVRGVSGNMIRHLQVCTYCPSEVVTHLKLLCAQKDAASFNKRHQTQNRSANVLLEGTCPASKKARLDEGQEKLQAEALRDSTRVAAKTSSDADMMPSRLPLLSSETNEELISTSNSLSFDDNLSIADKVKTPAEFQLGKVINTNELSQLDRRNKPHASQSSNDADRLSQLLVSSTLLTNLPWDWMWTEQSALTLGNLYAKLKEPADVLSTVGTTSHEKQISKMKDEQVGVTLAVSWWAAKYPRSNFVLFSLVNALGEASCWDLIDMGVGDITTATLADKIKSNLVSLQKSGLSVINIVADSSLSYVASRLAISSSNQESAAIPVLPCFSHTLQILLGVVLTGSDSSMQTLGEVIEIVQMFSSHRVLNVLRRECGDPGAVLHAPSRHNWYSFIEAIDSVRQHEDMIKIISLKVVQASSKSRDLGDGLLRKTVPINLRKDSAGNTMDELAECRLSAAVLRSIQNEEFWDNLEALSELMSPIKETYKMMSGTLRSAFPLSNILYQFGRMHQHYKKILSDWEGSSCEGRSVDQVRCLLQTIDDMWRLYDQSLMVLGYTLDYRLERQFLARHQSSLQWLAIGGYAKRYFCNWFCAKSVVQHLSRLLALSNEAAAHFMEDMLAFKKHKFPFDSNSMYEFDNPKHFYLLVSDSHPMIHMFGSRLFSIVTSTPFLGDVFPEKCFLPSPPSITCSQHSLLPLLRMKLFSQTALRLPKRLIEIIHDNQFEHDIADVKSDVLHSLYSESRSDLGEIGLSQRSNLVENASMGEGDNDNFVLNVVWSKKQWEAVAKEWRAHWKKEVKSFIQLHHSNALDPSFPELSLDQIFIQALPSRLPHIHYDAAVDV